jgi:spore coat polysaccharide biosynthesis predicted glycosyltransferase SpsG
MTAPRSIAEETYSLPVLMDQEEEETEEYMEVVVNGIVKQIRKK